MQRSSLPTGIRVRHDRDCDRQRCRCKTLEASVFSKADDRKIRAYFTNLAEAKTWRQDALVAVRRRTLRAPSDQTVREAWEDWLDGARAGTIRTRSGDAFKPSTLRGYEQSMARHVLDDLGALRLSEVRRSHVQALANRLLAKGLNASTVRNMTMPLRALYRHAIALDLIALNPTTGLMLPAVRGKRDRIASPAEAEQLLAALDDDRDRALWATAFYAGLRCGELMALRWQDVDLAGGLIQVEQAYDPKARQFVAPKSRAGRRRVPIPAVLKLHLMAIRRPSDLVFGDESPFDYWRTVERAKAAWRKTELEPIGLHEARHTYASLMIAAGVNAKALSTFMGHASITITLDRYGHLMPGGESEAAALLDRFLDGKPGAQTGAQMAHMA
jgi:integrase